MNVCSATGLPDTVRDLPDNPPVRVFRVSIRLQDHGACFPIPASTVEYP